MGCLLGPQGAVTPLRTGDRTLHDTSGATRGPHGQGLGGRTTAPSLRGQACCFDHHNCCGFVVCTEDVAKRLLKAVEMRYPMQLDNAVAFCLQVIMSFYPNHNDSSSRCINLFDKLVFYFSYGRMSAQENLGSLSPGVKLG